MLFFARGWEELGGISWGKLQKCDDMNIECVKCMIVVRRLLMNMVTGYLRRCKENTLKPATEISCR